MPVYPMICDKCEHVESFFCSYVNIPKKCPQCKTTKFRQNYGGKNLIVEDTQNISVYRQSQINAKRMGKEQMEMMMPTTPKAETPFWREPGSKPLDLSTIKDLTKYVETGDKN